MRIRPRDTHMGPSDDRLNWIKPFFLNGWVDYADATFRAASWALDEFGWVVIRGLISNSSSITAGVPSTIFLLPNDFRPAQTDIFPAIGAVAGVSSHMRIDVTQEGLVQYTPTVTGAVSHLALAARFKPEKRLVLS